MNRTVLVIEDNAVNMKLVGGLLGLLGCRVLEAQEAESGLDLLGREDVDLVLMDIQLPGMDGISACRVIREDMGRNDLPVIAISALAMEEDVSTAMESGFDGYITKPIDTKGFLELISGWLSGERRRPDAARRPLSRRLGQKRILVVDDSMTNVKLLRSMLQEELYEIIEAYNGRQALDAVAASIPDVIFLDIMMPDMDGYEVTRRLKENPETAHIPIVMVTALDGMEDRVQGLNMGAEDVLVKPVNRVEVQSRARSMVRLSEYQKQLSIREQAADALSPGNAVPGVVRPSKIPSILLVEDNRQDANLFLMNLGEEEYDIEVAGDGGRALKLLEERSFDLVLLDLVLPDTDGLSILNRIRERDLGGSPQVAIITALNDLDTRLKGIEQGADDYLVKPVHPRELQARIRVLLRKKGYIDGLKAGHQNALGSAIRDDLTGVYNRAYLGRYLDLEIKRSRRHGYPISVVMADVDDFRSYNARFGRLVGDLVIREVAAILRRTFREVDLVARFGGDEFVVVLPYCSRDEMAEIVKRARDAVAGHAFPTEGDLESGSVTISMGTAAYPEEAATVEDLIRRAEEELLEHKTRTKGGSPTCAGEART